MQRFKSARAAQRFSACMPPFTTPSTFNAISSRARRSGSSEPRRRINGEMRLPQLTRLTTGAAAVTVATAGTLGVVAFVTSVGAVLFAGVCFNGFPVAGSGVGGPVSFAVAFAVAVVFIGAIVVATLWASTTAITRGWQGPFLAFFGALMVAGCLMSGRLLSSLGSWEVCGPLLLFIGLLTLLNAPFDWASLGLTRALLRRGLELGGWWPYTLALVDAALAAVIIAALALTMVVAVQAFDALAVHGGGSLVLPLNRLFTGIAAHPTAPEYWWLYALLLSTMIPSLVNLVIGGASPGARGAGSALVASAEDPGAGQVAAHPRLCPLRRRTGGCFEAADEPAAAG